MGSEDHLIIELDGQSTCRTAGGPRMGWERLQPTGLSIAAVLEWASKHEWEGVPRAVYAVPTDS